MNPGSLHSPSIAQTHNIEPVAFAAEPMPDSAFTKGLLKAIIKYLGARGQLLGIEIKEALKQTITLILWLSVAAIGTFAGWLLLASSLVGVLAAHFEWSWMKAAVIVGAAHFLIALIAAVVAWQRLTKAHWFADSLNELKKDHSWLKNQSTKN